jgi:3-hydroxyacyl-[acyl-carrier-protein] dehydratase
VGRAETLGDVQQPPVWVRRELTGFTLKTIAMRFLLLDAIQSYEPGVQLTAIKNVAMSEEYLADHFPEFPVLPGVFMLEAATQAAAWLLRLSENFAHSVITLKEVRNIKYAGFVPPGHTLKVTVAVVKREERLATFKVEGQIGDRPTLSGRLVLETYNLGDRNPDRQITDKKLQTKFRKTLKILMPAAPAATAS